MWKILKVLKNIKYFIYTVIESQNYNSCYIELFLEIIWKVKYF